jgi:CRP-like cAMP-binding protein
MPTDSRRPPLDGAEALLAATPLFATLSPGAIAAMARELRELRFGAGETIVREGDAADRLFFLVAGAAEVSTLGRSGPVALATLGEGELFGELALLTPERVRTATVVALEPSRVWSLPAAALEEALRGAPEAQEAFARAVEGMLRVRFLKRATPFSRLPATRLRTLADRLESVEVEAGATILRQGDLGDACYLLRHGRVEVLHHDEGGEERELASLGEGSLFGEGALLTTEPRNATVRALEPCQLLLVHRADLEAVIADERAFVHVLLELLSVRHRPRRAPGVVAEPRTTPSGEPIVILKDPARHAYYRLSAQGHFLWERMDGRATVRDLTLDHFVHFHALAPQLVLDVVAGLLAAGFVEAPELAPRLREHLAVRPTGWRRVLLAARGALEWQWSIPGCDALVTGAYRWGARYLFREPVLAALALVALGGLGAFLWRAPALASAVRLAGVATALPLVYLARLGSAVFHEGGHALVTKHFGRSVRRAGVGWYWFGPVAFVDTSDMWLGTRGERVLVNLAGMAADLVTSGAASLAIAFVTSPLLRLALWQYALLGYLGVLLNLNPLLEYDGYYVLSDLLDRPNLRRRSLAWLGSRLVPGVRERGLLAVLRSHAFDALYALASAVFVVVMAWTTLIVYRLYLQAAFEHLVPAVVARSLAWVAASAVALLALSRIASEMRPGAAVDSIESD